MALKDSAVILYGKDDLRIEEVAPPKPQPYEALLQMECVGICGSDVHFWSHGRMGTVYVTEPTIIGHEASGTVLEVGEKVKHLKPGDQVAIEPGVSCCICEYCKLGLYNICPDMKFCACPPCPGNLRRYYVQAAHFLHKLPDSVSLEEGALMEPLTVAVYSCQRGGVTADSKVLILGAGPIGLVVLLAAKAFGATKVIITDLIEHRLKVAKSFGADFVLKTDPKQDEEATVKNILETFGEEPTISFDCTGLEPAVRLGLRVTARAGTMVLVGMSQSEMKLPIFDTQCKEVDIKGIFRYRNAYKTALGLIASGKLNVKPLITHHFKFEDSLKAFQVARDEKDTAIKVMIHVNPKWKSS